jgi:hypothetical protein
MTKYIVENTETGKRSEHKSWKAAVRAASQFPAPRIFERDRDGEREYNILGEFVGNVAGPGEEPGAPAKSPALSLYFNAASDFSIVDDSGKVYTPAEARSLWEARRVTDYNLALFTVIQLGWDVEEARRFYKDMGRTAQINTETVESFRKPTP